MYVSVASGHIFPHLAYYLMSVIAACLVIYNFYTGKTPHEKLAGEGICFIWIFVVMWQLWPPIGVVLGEIWAEMRNKDETEAAPAVDPKVRHLHPFRFILLQFFVCLPLA